MTKNSRLTLNLNPVILWPAGCINQNEIPSLPARLRLDSDAIGHHTTLFDGNSHNRLNFLTELLLVGSICDRLGFGNDRGGQDGEYEA